MNSTLPKVSCIIPAFNRVDHFSRCLLSLLTQDVDCLEIVVSDDSSDEGVLRFTEAIQAYAPYVRYVDGPRSGRPVDNWNQGISAARGQFLHIIHQDEFLVEPTFLSRAVSSLEATGSQAVFGNIAPIAVSRASNFSRTKRAALALGLKPWTLYAANWIGPTGTVVFRAAQERRFDTRLVNTVDVDFYYRLIGPDGRPDFLPGIAVSGLGHHDAQITAKIDPCTLSIDEIETIISRRPEITSLQKAILLSTWRSRKFLSRKLAKA